MGRKRALSKTTEACPCGTGKLYSTCCGQYHEGLSYPNTVERLMRSRYSAYALGDLAYLKKSWSKHTLPSDLALDLDTQWTKLKIIDRQAGSENDETGVVEFTATYKLNGKAYKLAERSVFVRQDGKWVYDQADASD